MVFVIFNVYTSYIYSIKCDVNYTYFSDENAIIPRGYKNLRWRVRAAEDFYRRILFIFVIILVLFTRIAQYKMMYGSYVMRISMGGRSPLLYNPARSASISYYARSAFFVWIILRSARRYARLVKNFYRATPPSANKNIRFDFYK